MKQQHCLNLYASEAEVASAGGTETDERRVQKMKKSLIGGVVAAACIAATTVVAGATQASANPNDCPNNAVCMWGDSNYEGRFLFVPGTSRSNVGSHMNDHTTALWNRTGSRVCPYDHAKYGGSLLAIVNTGESRPNIGSTANDRISSWRAC
ncbi:peptidase inhibitor family I36 protein [Streptomyces zagrosensis]|uniref:Peptidase inhibitor n=1 Tax=Streptomyces zagrosensis TaxID=1042984 RepID=A0A7W9QAK4_9ACTN|nr:peptidase inhibitor family I36 protein [Streptomyces zagrosensis]MBB5935727.1 hypothetical protein [Streptomyces zagrosensis]